MNSPASLLYEACVETPDEAMAAERRGARRIELCSALDQEGLTPAPEVLTACLDALSVPVMVMIRPRGGDFVYREAELVRMEEEIAKSKAAGAAGVVFGLLTDENAIDAPNTERLARAAAPLPVTFHKAIDRTADILEAFRTLNAIEGIARVLTSGGRDTAWDGREVLKVMHDLPGRRIELIAAGRLTPKNREAVAAYTGIRELHGRRIV